MKFKSDIEVQAGLKDSSGAAGTSGQVLSSNGATVSWVDSGKGIANDIQNTVKAGVAINKGQAVYVTSADGTNIVVGLASNTSEATSSKTLGLLNATVTVNGTADVVQIGKLAGLNTIGANVGDPVWLGTNGNLIYGLANKPYAPAHLVYIGVVTRVNANNGEIFVNVQNGFELKEIHDVDIVTTTPVNGNVLGYDGSLWVNKTIPGWLGYTPANQSTTISTTAPLQGGGDLSTNRTLSITQASASASGFLSSTDWNTFNNKTSNTGTVTSVNGTGGYGGLTLSGTVTSSGNITLGGTPTGTWPISVSGNANTATNADYANASGVSNTTLAISGTTSFIPKFTSGNTLGNSLIYDNGTNVGIGTSSPLSKLHLSFTSDSDGLRIQNSNRGHSYLFTTAGGSAEFFTLYDVENTQHLYFAGNTGHSWNTLGSERMRITSGGNVGIGTTSPASIGGFTTLAVNGSTGGLFDLMSSGTTYGRLYSITNNLIIEGVGASNIQFAANAIERMRITSGGNVGIGTTSPSAKLSVTGGGVATSISNVGSTLTSVFNTANPAISLGIGYVGTDIPMIQSFNNTNNTSNNLTINPFGGNVGIGTTAPTSKLEVAGKVTINSSVSGDVITNIVNTSSSGYGARFQGGGGNSGLYLAAFNDYAGNSKMLIDGSGNIGIGTNTPNFQTSGRTVLDVNGSSQSLLALSIGTNPTGYIGVFESAMEIASISNPMMFTVNDAERARITTDGYLAIGTTIATSKLTVDGLPSFLDNAHAISEGMVVGSFYHTAGILKVVI